MPLLPSTKDITAGDPMADYVNVFKAWDKDVHDQYFVRFHDDPRPSQVMLEEEFYTTDVDGSTRILVLSISYTGWYFPRYRHVP